MGKTKVIAFKVTEEKLAEIGRIAERKGQSLAGYVRQLVYEATEKETA